MALLNFEMSLDGMSDAQLMPSWRGPGAAFDARLEEGTQRTFLRRWLREMRRPGAKEG